MAPEFWKDSVTRRIASFYNRKGTNGSCMKMEPQERFRIPCTHDARIHLRTVRRQALHLVDLARSERAVFGLKPRDIDILQLRPESAPDILVKRVAFHAGCVGWQLGEFARSTRCPEGEGVESANRSRIRQRPPRVITQVCCELNPRAVFIPQ